MGTNTHKEINILIPSILRPEIKCLMLLVRANLPRCHISSTKKSEGAPESALPFGEC